MCYWYTEPAVRGNGSLAGCGNGSLVARWNARSSRTVGSEFSNRMFPPTVIDSFSSVRVSGYPHFDLSLIHKVYEEGCGSEVSSLRIHLVSSTLSLSHIQTNRAVDKEYELG